MRLAAVLFVLMTAPALAADPVACPPAIDVTPQATVAPIAGWRALPMAVHHVLAGARLFDGDPADMADLVPDRNTTAGNRIGMIWELRPSMSYTFVCVYAGTSMTMAMKVPSGVKQCSAATRKFTNARPPDDTYLEASCR